MHSISFTFFKKYKNELFHLQNFKYLPDDFPWHDHRIARWFDEPSLQHGLSLGCHSTCLYIIPSVPVVFWTLICLLRILPYFLTGVVGRREDGSCDGYSGDVKRGQIIFDFICQK